MRFPRPKARVPGSWSEESADGAGDEGDMGEIAATGERINRGSEQRIGRPASPATFVARNSSALTWGAGIGACLGTVADVTPLLLMFGTLTMVLIAGVILPAVWSRDLRRQMLAAKVLRQLLGVFRPPPDRK